MKIPCVYILASKPDGASYVGVTSNLIQRMPPPGLWRAKDDGSAARPCPRLPVIVLGAPLDREVQRETSFAHFHAPLSGDERQ